MDVQRKVLTFDWKNNKFERSHDFLSVKLNLLIFNLNVHTVHCIYMKVVHQTPEILACKAKIYIAPESFQEGSFLSYFIFDYSIKSS